MSIFNKGLSKAEEQQNAWQAEQNMLDREFQRQMMFESSYLDMDVWRAQFEKENAEWLNRFGLQNEEWRKQQDINYETWQRQQDYMNLYNSPTQEVKRYMAAGVNPAALYAKGGVSSAPIVSPASSTSVANPSVSSPKGASMVTGSASGSPSGVNGRGEFQNTIEAISTVGELVKEGILGYDTLSMLGANLQGKIKQNQYQDLLNSYQGIYNGVYAATGSKKEAATIVSLLGQAYNQFAQGDTEESKRSVNNALGRLYRFQGDKAEKQLPFAVAEIESYVDEMKSTAGLNRAKVGTEKSQQTLNYASAENQRALARFNNYQTDFLEMVQENRIGVLAAELESLNYKNAIDENQLKIGRTALSQAEYAESNKEVIFWRDFLFETIDKGIDVLDLKNRMRSSKAWQSMSESDRLRTEKKVEQMQYELDNPIEETATAKDKKGRVWTAKRRRQ